MAMVSKSALEEKIGSTVKTEVIPIRSFTMAEDYHQKYYLKLHDGLKREVSNIYPHHPELVYSTAVTRINGYLGGYGTKNQLAKEIESLGLSAESREILTRRVR